MIKEANAVFDPGEIVLTGKEVVLRPLALSDADGLWEAAREDRATYLYNHVPDSLEMSSIYIKAALVTREGGRRYPFAILREGKIVGTTSFSDYDCWHWPSHTGKKNSISPDVCEVGYTWLASSAQRTGCNTECKFLLFQYAFEVWGVCRIAIRTDERNDRSRRAIERVGGQFEGIKRADKPGWDGTIRNSAYYSLVDSEWPAVKARLVGLIQ